MLPSRSRRAQRCRRRRRSGYARQARGWLSSFEPIGGGRISGGRDQALCLSSAPPRRHEPAHPGEPCGGRLRYRLTANAPASPSRWPDMKSRTASQMLSVDRGYRARSTGPCRYRVYIRIWHRRGWRLNMQFLEDLDGACRRLRLRRSRQAQSSKGSRVWIPSSGRDGISPLRSAAGILRPWQRLLCV